jgi:hypothetical protein
VTRFVPFEEYPLSVAVPHHCGRCLLAVSYCPTLRFTPKCDSQPTRVTSRSRGIASRMFRTPTEISTLHIKPGCMALLPAETSRSSHDGSEEPSRNSRWWSEDRLQAPRNPFHTRCRSIRRNEPHFTFCELSELNCAREQHIGRSLCAIGTSEELPRASSAYRNRQTRHATNSLQTNKLALHSAPFSKLRGAGNHRISAEANPQGCQSAGLSYLPPPKWLQELDGTKIPDPKVQFLCK